MIRLQDLTPAIYYEQSRDFQFIGRLYDLVLNYIKTNAVNLYNLPSGKDMDEQLLNLLALTLGFKPTRKYNSKQLRAICSVLPTVLKHKGSIQALVLATNALLAAEGVRQPLDYTMHPREGITLYVAQELEDLNLFTDLLDYLLPAGLSCSIVKESQVVSKVETILGVTDEVNIYYQTENILSQVATGKENLSAGQLGANSSILANITMIRQLTSDKLTSRLETETYLTGGQKDE
jgi:hypothetical protein